MARHDFCLLLVFGALVGCNAIWGNEDGVLVPREATGVGGEDAGGTLGSSGGAVGGDPGRNPSGGTIGSSGAAGDEPEPTVPSTVGVIGGRCAPDGATGCEGAGQRLLCDNGLWIADGTCTENERCDTREENAGVCQPVIPECEDLLPGDATCRERERFACGDDLVTREDVELCDAGCVEGACSPCHPGDRQCAELQPLVCDETGSWQDAGVRCEFLCEAGQCAGECSPGTKRCDPSAPTTPQVCDEAGAWEGQTPCVQACNAGDCGPCVVGDRRCNSQHPQVCADDATWVNEPSCATQNMTCLTSTGECGGICGQGQVNCNGTFRQTCTSNGTWTVPGTIVPGTCGAECTPGSKRCTGTNTQTAQVCNSNGLWATASNCDSSNRTCNAGDCVGVCVKGTTRCNGTWRQSCSGTGSWSNASDCSSSSCAQSGSGATLTANCDASCRTGVFRETGWNYQSSGGGCWSNGDICGGTYRLPTSPSAGRTFNRVRFDVKLLRGAGGSCKSNSDIIGRFECCSSTTSGCNLVATVTASQFYNQNTLSSLSCDQGRYLRFYRTATGRTNTVSGSCEFGYQVTRLCP